MWRCVFLRVTMLSVLQIVSWNSKIIQECWIEKELEASDRGLIKVPSRNLAWRTDSVRIAAVLAEIRTEHIPYTSLERYCYISLFRFFGRYLSVVSEEPFTSVFRVEPLWLHLHRRREYFYPEDEGGRVLRNIGIKQHSGIFWRGWSLNIHRHEKLVSYTLRVLQTTPPMRMFGPVLFSLDTDSII
jgi:hypothetical protein